jgi:hypothetical protein
LGEILRPHTSIRLTEVAIHSIRPLFSYASGPLNGRTNRGQMDEHRPLKHHSFGYAACRPIAFFMSSRAIEFERMRNATGDASENSAAARVLRGPGPGPRFQAEVPTQNYPFVAGPRRALASITILHPIGIIRNSNG